MLKKTITYTDFDGNERTENIYFNLTKAELAEWELTTNGGMVQKLQAIAQSNDGPTITKAFKDIIRKSYGKKSDDGRTFMKSDEIFKEFEATQAYSDLFVELVTDVDKATAFINAIMPNDEQQGNVVPMNK